MGFHNLNWNKTSKEKIPTDLLEREILKYNNFEELKKAWLFQIKHGIYWHITDNPNFTINPEMGPRDMSSLSSGKMDIGKLMITSDLENWSDYYGDSRLYAALIDMSLVPNSEFYQVSRGFGNEFYVTDPSLAKVVSVYPIEEALLIDKNYDMILPQSEKELHDLYDKVHGIISFRKDWYKEARYGGSEQERGIFCHGTKGSNLRSILSQVLIPPQFINDWEKHEGLWSSVKLASSGIIKIAIKRYGPVYHGSRTGGIKSFDFRFLGTGVVRNKTKGFFFTSSYENALYYTDPIEIENSSEYLDEDDIQVYGDGPYYALIGENVNIGGFSTEEEALSTAKTVINKNNMLIDANTEGVIYEQRSEEQVYTAYLTMDNPLIVEGGHPSTIANEALQKGYDGAIIKDVVDGNIESDIYVVFDQSQIELEKK